MPPTTGGGTNFTANLQHPARRIGEQPSLSSLTSRNWVEAPTGRRKTRRALRSGHVVVRRAATARSREAPLLLDGVGTRRGHPGPGHGQPEDRWPARAAGVHDRRQGRDRRDLVSAGAAPPNPIAVRLAGARSAGQEARPSPSAPPESPRGLRPQTPSPSGSLAPGYI